MTAMQLATQLQVLLWCDYAALVLTLLRLDRFFLVTINLILRKARILPPTW